MLKILVGYAGVYMEFMVEGAVTFGVLTEIAVKVFGLQAEANMAMLVGRDLKIKGYVSGQPFADSERVCDHVDESRRFVLSGV